MVGFRSVRFFCPRSLASWWVGGTRAQANSQVDAATVFDSLRCHKRRISSSRGVSVAAVIVPRHSRA